MSAVQSRSIASLRRGLLTRGFTLRPVCGSCGKARDPRDFVAGGVCQRCAAAPEVRSSWLPSLHNNCADHQPVELVRVDGAVRITKHPSWCRGCETIFETLPEYSAEELEAGWSAAVEAL